MCGEAAKRPLAGRNRPPRMRALPHQVALSNPSGSQAEVMRISQVNPGEPGPKPRPQDLPKATRQTPAELALEPRLPPPALRCLFRNLLRSKGNSTCPSLYRKKLGGTEGEEAGAGSAANWQGACSRRPGQAPRPSRSHLTALLTEYRHTQATSAPRLLARQLPRVPVWPLGDGSAEATTAPRPSSWALAPSTSFLGL